MMSKVIFFDSGTLQMTGHSQRRRHSSDKGTLQMTRHTARGIGTLQMTGRTARGVGTLSHYLAP